MAAFAEFYSIRSAVRRLKVWPFKKHAWLANVAICRGIRYYYAKRGRPVPRFADFLDPKSPAWKYYATYGDVCGNEVYGDDGCGCESALEKIALQAVTMNDPYRRAAEAVAAMGAESDRTAALMSA
jgi:hypothetical protein